MKADYSFWVCFLFLFLFTLLLIFISVVVILLIFKPFYLFFQLHQDTFALWCLTCSPRRLLDTHISRVENLKKVPKNLWCDGTNWLNEILNFHFLQKHLLRKDNSCVKTCFWILFRADHQFKDCNHKLRVYLVFSEWYVLFYGRKSWD